MCLHSEIWMLFLVSSLLLITNATQLSSRFESVKQCSLICDETQRDWLMSVRIHSLNINTTTYLLVHLYKCWLRSTVIWYTLILSCFQSHRCTLNSLNSSTWHMKEDLLALNRWEIYWNANRICKRRTTFLNWYKCFWQIS